MVLPNGILQVDTQKIIIRGILQRAKINQCG